MGRVGAVRVTEFRAGPVGDWEELGLRWRALEARVPASFFQSWTWVGCLAQERYPDPLLLEATEQGQTVALALCNRRRGLLGGTLALHESGIATLDSPFIEHNGVLGAPAPALLKLALRGWQRLVLSGVDEATLAALRQAGAAVWVRQSRFAPYADLTRDFLAGRSANTRQQLRRSDRAYGAPTLQRAATEAQAHAFLDEMAMLHQAAWRARGHPGAFADPFFGRFHHALVAAGFPRGEIDLLRVTAADQVVGILYNFRFRDAALAYQSGFDFDGAGGARKPGLTCHHAAVRFSAASGLRRYDFLAGDDRYKRSLSDAAIRLHWIEAGSALQPCLAWRRALAALQPSHAPRADASEKFTTWSRAVENPPITP